nr:zinc finger BED domain-containing protein RICESLEEPER 3 [Tanacetum cinerariifolium]
MFIVLSRMAMDLISVQASSVASEPTFSTSGRVLSIRKTRLTSASLEMCMGLNDYLDAKERDPNETMILGRPFLPTLHARINVFHREISLGYENIGFLFDMDGNVDHPTVPIKKVCMANSTQKEESFNPLEIGEDLFSYDSSSCFEFKKHNHLHDTTECNEDTFVGDDNVLEPPTGRKGRTKIAQRGTVT